MGLPWLRGSRLAWTARVGYLAPFHKMNTINQMPEPEFDAMGFCENWPEIDRWAKANDPLWRIISDRLRGASVAERTIALSVSLLQSKRVLTDRLVAMHKMHMTPLKPQ